VFDDWEFPPPPRCEVCGREALPGGSECIRTTASSGRGRDPLADSNRCRRPPIGISPPPTGSNGPLANFPKEWGAIPLYYRSRIVRANGHRTHRKEPHRSHGGDNNTLAKGNRSIAETLRKPFASVSRGVPGETGLGLAAASMSGKRPCIEIGAFV
jgi:hypothetical protein